MVGKVERRAHRPDGGLAMFEAKPTAGGSGWPQLGAQLPPRGDVTLFAQAASALAIALSASALVLASQ
jgi:hypothetical protein